MAKRTCNARRTRPAPRVLGKLLHGGLRLHCARFETVADPAGAVALFDRIVTGGGAEGLVLHASDGRTFKVKPEISIDAAVIGYVGTDHSVSELLLALIAPSGRYQSIGCVRTGWSRRESQELAARLATCACASPPVTDRGWQLRWFTPTVEVDLCGHATLASAHILWEVGRLESASAARFFTRSGGLTAWKREKWIELDFPADVERPSSPNGDLEKALGGRPVHRVDGKFDHLVEFGSEAEVRALAPEMAGLARLPGRGVIATARAELGSEFYFVSRFFAPAAGISEDPVTGSAHCLLAPYWGKRLGKTTMVGFQCSSRGGMVRVRVAGARTILGGQAVTVAVGEIVSDVAAAPRL